MRNPKASAITNDPAYKLAKAFEAVANRVRDENKESNEKLSRARRLFMAGLREMNLISFFIPTLIKP